MTTENTETMPEQTPEQQEQLVKYRPQLLALHKEVLAARDLLWGTDDGDGVSDFEFTQLVRLAYPSNEPDCADLLQRIEVERAAIKCAIAAGKGEFISRLAFLQKIHGC